MKIIAALLLSSSFLLAQVPSCDKLPEGDIEYKECETTDQRVGFTCKALYVGGVLVRKVYAEIPKESPIPSPTSPPPPSPIIEPSPIIPSPIPSSSPDTDFYCTVQEDGFYPTPPINECPPCWKDSPDVIGYWGIAKGGDRKCTGANCGCGVVINAHITPHSTDDRFLRHRYDFEKKQFSGSETHKGCQPAEDSQDVPDIWVYPPNDTAGKCDPLSSSRYWCHHKAKAGTCGKTKFEVHEPPFKSIIVNIP